jgi:ribosomal protein S18 acetylase RimI-like enzyme
MHAGVEGVVGLRSVAAGDEEFLFTVYAATRQDEIALTDWSHLQKEEFLRMQFIAQHRHYVEYYPGAQFQVIQVGGQPAGRLYLHHRKSEIRIIDIALLPEFRNRGIGSSLLGQVLAEGRRCGLPVTIHVECFNPALHLYERLGFRLVEDKGVYFFLEWSPQGGGE